MYVQEERMQILMKTNWFDSEVYKNILFVESNKYTISQINRRFKSCLL